MGRVGTEATLQDILGVMRESNLYLQNIAQQQKFDIGDAVTIKNIIRAGLAKRYFNIGDQVISTYMHGDTPVENPWDFAHINENGDVYLKMHYAYPDGLPFDAPEAIYSPDTELAPGTYHIVIGQNYGAGWVPGNGIQFTLEKAVPAGGQICIACGGNFTNDPAAGRTLTTYATAGDTTILESTTTSAGKAGTNLGTVSPENAQKTSGSFNSISRVIYGSGRYSESAVRQWLNSEASEVGKWWSPKNKWDRPPAQAETTAGFLSKLPADFVAMLDDTDITVALNTIEGFPEDTETVHDRIFLPSLEEMYINPQLAGVEGEAWDYFKLLAQQSGLPGEFQQGEKYPILKTYNLTSHTSPVEVVMRSCYRGGANHAGTVNSSGSAKSNSALVATRGCPACKIKAS